jgi:hypothetical protein
MQGGSMVERRRHKRYPMPRGTFVILRNKLDPLRNHTQMSIGEIAMVLYKSESEVMGQVTELSLGGIGFDCNFSGIVNADDVELDLLMTEKGIYLHNLPYSTIPIKSAGNGKKKKDPQLSDKRRPFQKIGCYTEATNSGIVIPPYRFTRRVRAFG